MLYRLITIVLFLLLIACSPTEQKSNLSLGFSDTDKVKPTRIDDPNISPEPAEKPFRETTIATFEHPWAIEFIPDGRMLISEKVGRIQLVTVDGESHQVEGVPETDYGRQGGFGDIVLHPEFSQNHQIYYSYVEAGKWNKRGSAVARAKLLLKEDGGAALADQEIIWRQHPKVTGRGHFGQRIAFGPDGFLWISSGERQKFDPAQDLQTNLGKIIRLHPDGSIPNDNPFADQGGVTAQIWSYGHRNPLGIAFDTDGRLWNTEMGPAHGDELNLVKRGANYGYPLVSNGDHYSGLEIPDHNTRPDLEAPKEYWVPAISPGSLLIYSGNMFPKWRGSALIGGLGSQSLIRVGFDGTSAREVERFYMDTRIREVEQGPDGTVWLLEDGDKGRLIKLTPKSNNFGPE